MQWLHLGARRRRQVLRRICGVHDRRRAAADRARIPYRRGRERHCQRREPVPASCSARSLLGGLSDHFGRKRMFIVEMIIFCVFLALLVPCATNFLSLVDLPVRARARARLRLSDRAHDHFGEHPQHQPRQARARRLRLSGGRRAWAAPAVGYAGAGMLPDVDAWRWMYATALVPGVLVTIGRFYHHRKPQLAGSCAARSTRPKSR